MSKMNAEMIVNTIVNMTTEQQNAFFVKLSTLLSEEDVKTIMMQVAFVQMFQNPEKYNAVMNACKDQFLASL